MSGAPNIRTPWYRSTYRQAVLVQLAALVVLGLAAWLVIHNVESSLKQHGIRFSFGFLGQRASFQVAEGTAFGVPYRSGGQDTYLKAALVGLYNTLRVSSVGILLATLLGVLVGLARLSNNWLVARASLLYTEVLRNTPLLVQLIVWYYVVILNLPTYRHALSFGPVYLSNQGLALPWLVQRADALNFFPVWLIACGLGALVFLRAWRARRGAGAVKAASLGLLAWLLIVLAGYAALGAPLEPDLPIRTAFGVQGGMQLSPEFTGLLMALAMYTSAFIAEIVRAGVLAVPTGQWDAARALGLSEADTLRLIVLPQALRTILPPLGNQYLNLTKNSSLAVYIGFGDLLNVLNSAGNITGQNLQALTLAGATYLALSLGIAALVNGWNRATQRASW